MGDILDTVQLTLSQVYETEFESGNNSNSFTNVLNKIIAQNLGAPKESDDKKVPFIPSAEMKDELRASIHLSSRPRR